MKYNAIFLRYTHLTVKLEKKVNSIFLPLGGTAAPHWELVLLFWMEPTIKPIRKKLTDGNEINQRFKRSMHFLCISAFDMIYSHRCCGTCQGSTTNYAIVCYFFYVCKHIFIYKCIQNHCLKCWHCSQRQFCAPKINLQCQALSVYLLFLSANWVSFFSTSFFGKVNKAYLLPCHRLKEKAISLFG